MPAAFIGAGKVVLKEHTFSRLQKIFFRARINGVLCCGKIHPSHHALYISYGGKEHAFKTGYEILIYRAPPQRPPPRPQLPANAHTPSVPVQNRFPGRGQPLASAQEIQGILERIRTTETLETARGRAMASRRPARPPPPLSSTTGAVSSSNTLKNSSCAVRPFLSAASL